VSPPSRKGRAKHRHAGFPIVGVGASAGGLEAFTQLLRKLPVDTGFGFVLVQHLDPQHASALTEILGRATTMPVFEAVNNCRVKANHVYVIPPDTTLGISRGILKVRPRSSSPLAPRSIDAFLEALAKDQEERAIGIVLSGAATDGTLGLEAIKAAGGVTFAQDASARYGSMPRSAVGSGCVDFVLPPAGIARELRRLARHPLVGARSRGPASARHSAQARERDEGPSFDEIRRLLRAHTGIDFSLYKPSTIQRRIVRRALLTRQGSLTRYADFLRGNVKELDSLCADVLISVTAFFRNPDAFAALKRKVLRPLLRKRSEIPLRVWVVGCATGEEAYSLAIALTEVAEAIPQTRAFQLFATDVSERNLDRARHGLYPKGQLRDVSPERLRRFFTAEDGGFRVVKALRERVVFARHNLVGDPPFSRMDLISCRNLMIYLTPRIQSRLLPTFHSAINPGGFLFLGASESVGAFAKLFKVVEKRQKIFTRTGSSASPFAPPLTSAGGQRGPAPVIRLRGDRRPAGTRTPWRGELDPQREADRVTINHFAPPGVLINSEMQILQFRGSSGPFLEPPAGRATFDLLKMARPFLMLPLRAAIQQAKATGGTVRTAAIGFDRPGRAASVSIVVVPLKNLNEPCFLVLFLAAEVTESPAHGPAAAASPASVAPAESAGGRTRDSILREHLERDLAETRDYLRTVQEQQAASQEEMQDASEEAESANEELQSLNEELETSKEELEATNEELTTVNEEVLSRNAELNRLNSDLINLQASARLAIVLLGRDRTIRRFSPQAEKQLHLAAADIGRPLRSDGYGLRPRALNALIARAITEGVECERQTQDAEGQWLSVRVRPYLNAKSEVDGAVLVLVDIDGLKRQERLLLAEQKHAESLIQTVPAPLVVLNSTLEIVSANGAFFRDFRLKAAQVVGRSLFELDRGSWNIPRLRRLLESILRRRRTFDDFEVTQDFPRAGRRSLLLNARSLTGGANRPTEILLGIRDVTALKLAADLVRDAQAKLAAHASHLEKVVAARTAQLTERNRTLKTSAATLRTRNDEYRDLLAQSQAMQRKLRLLTHRMIGVQEEERKSISRELHDEVVQTLVGISVELASLGENARKGGPHLKECVTRTQRLVEGSIDAVHRFARELRPAVLDNLGLVAALQAFSESLQARKGLKIQLSAQDDVDVLDGDRGAVLYRVAQEALNNVARHAHATVARVNLTANKRGVRMEITDDGRSFSVEDALRTNSSKRLGLIGMRERLEMVGGRLTLASSLGRGTSVIAELPARRKKSLP
jgi:two-component system, chemotaxis family, CheB/CheR fusion protein